MSLMRWRIPVVLLAHCIASYLCFSLLTAYWIAVGGEDWNMLLPLLLFAPITFPFLSFFAILSMLTGKLGGQQFAWPAAAFLYVPVFYFVRVKLNHRRERLAKLRESLCPICGYDLRATPNRCPECGEGNIKRDSSEYF